MVKLLSFMMILTGMSAIVYGAPTKSDKVTITVQNSCSHKVQVSQLTNDQGSGESLTLNAGSSTSISVPADWAGRLWGCSDCSAPNSLAEFRLGASKDVDYYDVSFVDGFNLPMTISPNSGTPKGTYFCGTPNCSTLPTCPDKCKVKGDDGSVIGCTSNCDQDDYVKAVKDTCPHVYSYPTDDDTSMFSCDSNNGYTVTFC